MKVKMVSPKRLLAYWQLMPKQQLGQNFLADPATARMIVTRSNLTREDVVLEIGAGLGALTFPLSKAVKKVYAVEFDRHIVPLLKSELATNDIENVTVIEKNILKMDLSEIMEQAGRKLIVCGNLPYNISSQVIVQLIRSRRSVQRAVFMFQKELAQRIAANPGKKDYGRISVMLQSCSEIRTLATINANQFYPKPRVDSQVLDIRFNRWLDRSVVDENLFFDIIKSAFSMRRKTLKNNLGASRYFRDKTEVHRLLEGIGIDSVRRAETLTKDEFAALCNEVSKLRKQE